MPLFHSNAVYAGWSVALGAGAAMAPAAFSASRFLPDVRRYGATYMNYVGKPLAYILATAEQPDDADNPLRIAFGNEAADRDIDRVRPPVRLRGVGRLRLHRDRRSSSPARRLSRRARSARASPASRSTTPRPLQECEVAAFDETGALVNADAATGELVNTSGSGLFRGYYNDPGATDQRMRHGMYWSGDLAYRDADGWIYLAGRTADWMRVDGENLTAAPIERILLRLDVISRVAVYPVPDELSATR